jgi:hypothetical protein
MNIDMRRRFLLTCVWKVKVYCEEHGTYTENGKIVFNDIHVISNSYLDAAEKAEKYYKNSYKTIRVVEIGVVIEKAIE